MHLFPATGSAPKMRYLEFKGKGVPLVMLHGLGCASSFEYPHVATDSALSGRPIFLIDLLGFGFSDQPKDFGYRIQDHAQKIYQFVMEKNLPKIDLFGHSMGGSIAIEAADLLGNKVRNLILAEANLDSGGGTFSQGIAAIGEKDYLRRGHLLTICQAESEGNEAWAATMRKAHAKAVYFGAKSLVEGGSPDWRSRFLQHSAKKAFIFGERNLPDPDTETLSAENIQILTVPNAGHSMGLENPKGLAQAIAQATR